MNATFKNAELLDSQTNPATDIPKIYVIHENSAWVEPLRSAFQELDLPYDEWFIHHGAIDLNGVPPEGVFYNRMSASSHTRDHRFAVELTGPLLAWLEAHGRRVINDRRALQLEVRKFEQYLSLKQFGIKVPQTVAAVGREQILNVARNFPTPFVLKPNRGGKGLDVQLFHSIEALEAFLADDPVISLDGVTLIQEYIKPADGHIVRMEFIEGKFHYAVRVDASGGFELCPADVCQVGDNYCPTVVGDKQEASKNKFEIIQDFQDPNISKYERFLAANGIEIGALEFVENEDGERFIYDVNTNTNYNAQAEQESGFATGGMERTAQFLGAELKKIRKEVLVAV